MLIFNAQHWLSSAWHLARDIWLLDSIMSMCYALGTWHYGSLCHLLVQSCLTCCAVTDVTHSSKNATCGTATAAVWVGGKVHLYSTGKSAANCRRDVPLCGRCASSIR